MQRVLRIAGIVLVLAYLSASQIAHAQDSHAPSVSTQFEKNSANTDDGPYFTIMRDNEVIASSLHENAKPSRIIVEFRTPPLSRTINNVGQAAKISQLDRVKSDHQRFANDLDQLFSGDAESVAGKSASEVQHFTTALNGVSLDVPRWMIKKLRALDYVKRVHEEGEVYAMKTDVLAPSRKPAANEGIHGETGQGIRIAVIDTGIDYMHPALGGGFGKGHKVTAGYDFVNDDPDPLDDNGHGTHVAGIAAGLGENWQGVAPEAELLAYKVLDEDGMGRDSWVLAAIEHAMNPDGDPLTDDAVDVINMS